MKRRNFFLTLFGSLFLGKAVAKTNVTSEWKMPSGNRYPDWTVAKLRDELFIGQSQIDNLKEYTEEDFKSIINIQAYVNQNPSSGWIIWPEGCTTRLHPHLEYIRLQSIQPRPKVRHT